MESMIYNYANVLESEMGNTSTCSHTWSMQMTAEEIRWSCKSGCKSLAIYKRVQNQKDIKDPTK